MTLILGLGAIVCFGVAAANKTFSGWHPGWIGAALLTLAIIL